MKPQRKVAAGGAGAAGSLVLVWVAGLFGVEMPAEVAVALTGLLSTGAAYLTPQGARRA